MANSTTIFPRRNFGVGSAKGRTEVGTDISQKQTGEEGGGGRGDGSYSHNGAGLRFSKKSCSISESFQVFPPASFTHTCRLLARGRLATFFALPPLRPYNSRNISSLLEEGRREGEREREEGGTCIVLHSSLSPPCPSVFYSLNNDGTLERYCLDLLMSLKVRMP